MAEQQSDAGGEPAAPDLDALVIECLEGFDEVGAVAVEAICARHPAHADVLRKRVALLLKAGLIAGPDDEQAEPFPEQLGDFELLRPLGGGGMGVVYLARQISLDREVALKLIRPEQLYFPGARKRFKREVLTVAGLQHAGIVPVYTVGEESGIPYFAMERVLGCTLQEVIDSCTARPEALSGADLYAAVVAHTEEAPLAQLPALFAGSWIETSLRILSEVCAAIEHAHDSGILHRDLKPSNIMLTSSGRVMLLDFGLSSNADAERLTRTGSQLGSLPYMAPEQVEGGALDRRTDVYQLGVTLYELVSLRTPYRHDSQLELRQAILSGRPLPLRVLNPAVPPELEIVCAAAMDLDPARRYASAAAFGADLRNVSEQRPISARKTGLALRTRRLMQRHPAASVALLLGSLLLVGGPTTVAILQAKSNASMRVVNSKLENALAEEERQRDEAEHQRSIVQRTNEQLGAALAETETQRDRAEANLTRALDTANSMLNEISLRFLAEVPQMTSVQSEALQDALRFYEQLARENADDPRMRTELAGAWRRLAEVYVKLGRLDDGREARVAELELNRQLLAEAPHDGGLRRKLALGLGNLSLIYQELSRLDEAEALSREAIDVVAAGLSEDDPDWDMRRELRNQGFVLGLALYKRGDLEGAAELFNNAAEIGRTLLSTSPDEGNDKFFLAKPLNGLGVVLIDSCRADEALVHLRAAIALLLDLRDSIVGEQKVLRSDLLDASVNLGNALSSVGERDEAEEFTRQAVVLADRLADEFSDQPDYQAATTSSRLMLANLLTDQERLVEAEDVLIEALGRCERLVQVYPGDISYESTQAALMTTLGRVASVRDEFEEALGLLERATELHERALAKMPNHPFFRRSFGAHLQVLAHVQVADGATAEAIATARRALQFEDPCKQHYGEVARILASCARRVRAKPESSAQYESLLGEIRALIRRALDEDAGGLAELASAPEFEELRSALGFAALMAEVESRAH